MAAVSLLNVTVLNNPAPFDAPYEFEITFECLESLSKDLEWKLTYVGSATSSEHDQELDSLLVGPIPVGVNKFVFQADPPNLSRIPNTEILGVTVILLTCSYDDREFVRVGYYVNNEYTDEALAAEPPQKPVIEKVQRNILAEKPRVTRFAIKWDSEDSAPAEYPPEQPEADTAEDDAERYGAEEEEEPDVEEVATEEAAELKGADAVMAEPVPTSGPVKEEDEASDAGSEDLEAESSGSDEEEEEEDEGEGDEAQETAVDEEMTDAQQATAQAAGEIKEEPGKERQPPAPAADVMVH